MPSVNLLPPELRGPEERLQKKLQKQKLDTAIKYVRPKVGQALAKQPSASFWQRLFAKPAPAAVVRPAAKAPLPIVPQVKKLAVNQPPVPRSTVGVKQRPRRLGFWRWLFKGLSQKPPAKFAQPTKTIPVGKFSAQPRPAVRPLAAKIIVRPASRQSFWQYFFRLKSEKLLAAPLSVLALPPSSKKSLPLAPFDWVAFFQTFVYLLIIIIILSFYLILRTTDNYFLRRDALVQRQLSDLQSRVLLLEQQVKQADEAANNPAANLAKSKEQLRQVEIWSAIYNNLVTGVQISNLELSQNQPVRVTGLALDENTLKRQVAAWQKIKEVANLQLVEVPPVADTINFIITFSWQSTVLIP